MDKEKIVIGSNLALLAAGLFFNYQSGNPSIGKITDTGDVPHGGRVDKYWKRFNLQPLRYLGAYKAKSDEWLYDPEKTVKHFNLKGIEFGNYLNQEERLNHLYALAFGLHDLAKVLDVEDSQIGLNGTLSVALGARGFGPAKAHYEPQPYTVINLTKTSGKGALAHEYAHALDNFAAYYICNERYFLASESTSFEIKVHKSQIRNTMEAMFEALYYQGDSFTTFAKSLADQSDYWKMRAEVFARTFEKYIFQKLNKSNITNRYLTAGSYENPMYPSAQLLNKASQPLDRFLDHVYSVVKKQKSIRA